MKLISRKVENMKIELFYFTVKNMLKIFLSKTKKEGLKYEIKRS